MTSPQKNFIQLLLTLIILSGFYGYIKIRMPHLAEAKLKGKVTFLNYKKMAIGRDWNFTQIVNTKNQHKLSVYKDYYEEIIKLFPKRADAYGMLGYIQYHLGDLKKAEESYKKALILNPKFFFYYYNLSSIHNKRGHIDEAASFLYKGIKYNDMQNFVSSIMSSKRIYMPIIQNISQEQNISPKHYFTEAHNHARKFLISFLNHKNLFEQAYQMGNTAIQESTKDLSFFYLHMGYALYHMQKYNVATALLGKSIQQNPEEVDAYRFLALCFKELGNHETAAKLLLQAKTKAKNYTSPLDAPIALPLYPY